MDDSIVVTRVTPALWRRQRALRLASLAQAPEAFSSSLAREEAFDDEVWIERAARPASYLASVGRVDVGGAGVFETDGAWEVNGMYVVPSARGTGVVEALMAAMHAHVLAEGVAEVGLGVMADNARGIAAYRRLGYRETGERVVLPDGREELLVRLVLPPPPSG